VHAKKEVCLVVLPTRTTNLNTLQTIIDSFIKFLQLQANVGPVGEYERIARVFLDSLGVKIFSIGKVAVSERQIAFLLKLVREMRHRCVGIAGFGGVPGAVDAIVSLGQITVYGRA